MLEVPSAGDDGPVLRYRLEPVEVPPAPRMTPAVHTAVVRSRRAADLRERVVQSFVGWANQADVYERGLEHIVRALRSDGLARGLLPPPKL